MDSEPEHGAVFPIRLPVGHPGQTESDAGAGTLTPLPRKTILVVDDDPMIGHLLSQMLALDGHEVRDRRPARPPP